MNRQQIENLKVGDLVQWTIDTVGSKALPNARWTEPRKVVRIFARGVSIKGKTFVCFYTEFGENASISGSISEGEEFYRLVA